MGATLEAFCCSNENREETIDNPDLQDSQITSTNNASKSNFIGQNKFPSNQIMPISDINKFLELKSPEDKNAHPFKDYILIEYLGKGEYSEVYIVKNKTNNEIFVLKKLRRNKLTKDDEITFELEK